MAFLIVVKRGAGRTFQHVQTTLAPGLGRDLAAIWDRRTHGRRRDDASASRLRKNPEAMARACHSHHPAHGQQQGAANRALQGSRGPSRQGEPRLLAALRAHLEAMALEGQVRDWDPDARALVFPTTYGNPLHYPYFLARIWRPLLGKAGVPYRRYHATRHTYATWLLADGADLRWVQSQMGHASVAQTADTYGHVQPDRHEAAAAGLDRYLT
jgi:hypothetical protein